MIRLVCLDADDTLWHNETVFRLSQARFAELVGPYIDGGDVAVRLADAEQRNLSLYGYGAKGFTLSMIEAALELGGDDLPARVVREVLDMGRAMLAHPVEPLDGVAEALAGLAERHRLVLVTKGDLFHQEAKLAASGLGGHFAGVEIVSEKTPDCYGRVFARYGVPPDRALMAGNSVRSDVLPVLEAGGWAALIPYPLVWAHEAADVPAGHPRLRQLDSLAELGGWINELEGDGP